MTPCVNTVRLRSPLLLRAEDERGAMWAVYEFAEKYLGVDPVGFWTDHEPERRADWRLGEILAEDAPRTFKYRKAFRDIALMAFTNEPPLSLCPLISLGGCEIRFMIGNIVLFMSAACEGSPAPPSDAARDRAFIVHHSIGWCGQSPGRQGSWVGVRSGS